MTGDCARDSFRVGRIVHCLASLIVKKVDRLEACRSGQKEARCLTLTDPFSLTSRAGSASNSLVARQFQVLNQERGWDCRRASACLSLFPLMFAEDLAFEEDCRAGKSSGQAARVLKLCHQPQRPSYQRPSYQRPFWSCGCRPFDQDVVHLEEFFQETCSSCLIEWGRACLRNHRHWAAVIFDLSPVKVARMNVSPAVCQVESAVCRVDCRVTDPFFRRSVATRSGRVWSQAEEYRHRFAGQAVAVTAPSFCARRGTDPLTTEEAADFERNLQKGRTSAFADSAWPVADALTRPGRPGENPRASFPQPEQLQTTSAASETVPSETARR